MRSSRLLEHSGRHAKTGGSCAPSCAEMRKWDKNGRNFPLVETCLMVAPFLCLYIVLCSLPSVLLSLMRVAYAQGNLNTFIFYTVSLYCVQQWFEMRSDVCMRNLLEGKFLNIYSPQNIQFKVVVCLFFFTHDAKINVNQLNFRLLTPISPKTIFTPCRKQRKKQRPVQFH